MIHIRLLWSHHPLVSICHFFASRLESRRRRNSYQVSVPIRWHLASLQLLLWITCHPRTPFGVHPLMEITASHPDNRNCASLRIYGWEVMDHPFYSPDVLCPSFWTPWKAPAWQTIYNRRRHEARCRFLVTVIWYRFILRRDSALIARWDRYIIVSGEWIQVWCVLSATHVPCVHRSQKFL